MASIGTKIVYGVEAALRELLGRVAEDYGLDAAELEQRYFGPVEAEEVFPESIASSPPPPKAPKKARKEGTKATASGSATAALCQGKTTKGLPCKKKAVAGRCFCAMHGPKEVPAVPTVPEEGTKSLATSPAAAVAEPLAKKKEKKKGGKKKAAPVEHSHPADDAVHHEGCEGCEVHGDVEERSSPEYAVRGSVRSRMMEMLSKVAAMEDEVIEEDE